VDFDQGLVGPFCSVERGFELCWWYVVEVAVQASGVVPVDPAQGGQLDVLDGLPGPGAGRSVDQFGLVVTVHGFSQGVVETLTNVADGGNRANLGQPLAETTGPSALRALLDVLAAEHPGAQRMRCH
jgi:hypothetical protein